MPRVAASQPDIVRIMHPTSCVPALLTALLALSFSSGCLAPPNRIDGTNYSAEDDPFIASHAQRIRASDELPQQPNLIQRVVLIGDSGVPMDSEPVLAALTHWAEVDPTRTTVVFLGDNVYPAGIEKDSVAEGEEIMRKQISATSALRIFIPGNHDWGHVGTDRLLRQQAYVDANGAEFMPRDGCPGPTLRTIVPPTTGISRGISVIAFDIDPWYFGEASVGECPGNKTPEDLGVELAKLLAENQDQWLVVAAHHPVRTGGPHGGFSRGALFDFVTGVIYYISGTLQDTVEEKYQTIMAPIEAGLASAPPTLYAAGHDHNLQVLEGDQLADYQIVSGAGSTIRVRDGHVTDIDGTLFAHGHAGFVVVDFIRSSVGEKALLHVVETDHTAPVFSMEIGTR